MSKEENPEYPTTEEIYKQLTDAMKLGGGNTLTYVISPNGGLKISQLHKSKNIPDEGKTQKEKGKNELMSDPVKIKEQLDRYVIGQDDAKIDLSIAFSEMYEGNDVNTEYKRSNILMMGPTGTGKTKLLETLSKVCDMPLEIIKVGAMVQEGIVGKTLSSAMKSLKEKLDKKDGGDYTQNPMISIFGGYMENNTQAPSKSHAIFYIDEIDKLCSDGRYRKNVYGDPIQDQLIGVMDASIEHGIDTSKVLFVGGGAFDGLEKSIDAANKKGAIGFNIGDQAEKESDSKPTTYVSEGALNDYGMKGELVGRFPIKTKLNHLGKDDLKQILTEAEGSVIKTTADFYSKTKDITLTFDDEALAYMAEKASESTTGARALEGVVEQVLRPYKFRVNEYKGKIIKITADDVKKVI